MLIGFTWILHLLPMIVSQCIINVNLKGGDLNPYSPLLLKPQPWVASGNEAFYFPTNNQDIMLDSNQKLELHCPGGLLKVKDRVFDNGNVTCQFHKIFRMASTGESVSMSDIQCSTVPQHSVQRTHRRCTAGSALLEIGFRLNNGIWLNQISVCFDSRCKRTLWTQSNVTSRIDGYSVGAGRRFFEEGGSFFNIYMGVENCYYIPHQRTNINKQLQLPPDSIVVINKSDHFFTRGHLSPKGDFVYGPQQLATFYFVNAAPQWKSLNNENWNELEISVRKYASSRRKDLLIYTGTHLQATFNGVLLFLHMDDSAGHIPVPRYYWKVVYDSKDEAGVAFIGVNSPYEDDLDPFCNNICDQLRWELSWQPYIKELGTGFCCNVNEFRKYVEFPPFSVKRLLVH